MLIKDYRTKSERLFDNRPKPATKFCDVCTDVLRPFEHKTCRRCKEVQDKMMKNWGGIFKKATKGNKSS